MVTDPGRRVVEPYVETDNSVETRKAVSDGFLAIHNVTSNRFWQFAALFGIMFVLGIIGAIFITIEADYEFGCQDNEFIQEKYGELSEENYRECLDSLESSTTIASFLTFISPVFILFGILLLVYEKGNK